MGEPNLRRKRVRSGPIPETGAGREVGVVVIGIKVGANAHLAYVVQARGAVSRFSFAAERAGSKNNEAEMAMRWR